MIIPSQRRTLVRVLAALSGVGGASVALHYARLGLTLSHYDARGHLVVARRILDSITPGWQQLGAVWLPLPHLLNAIPVQIDLFYRTGASATALSVLCFSVTTACIGWMVARVTGSGWAAVAGAAVFACNPNVLYLQATPMTEPLLLALTLLSVALLMAWTDAPEVDAGLGLAARRPAVAVVGWTMALACLSRYEAWPVIVLALAVTLLVQVRRGAVLTAAIGRVLRVAVYPAVAIIAFFVFSRVVVGAWFLDDFFVPENPAQGHPSQVLAQIAWGTEMLSGRLLVATAAAGAVGLLFLALRGRADMMDFLPLTLAATSAVPFVAFLDGHPYRIRYMVPLIATEAICAGVLAGLVSKRVRFMPTLALVALIAYELRPLDASAPMVLEAQWDRPNIIAREPVTRCLTEGYDHTSIMASMGSLGHYMQDLSRAGFALKDFLHEGNGDIWLNALRDPRPFAGWMLIEEKAEGGDMLAHTARESPRFLDGFSRVCEGAGVALYRRHTAGPAPAPDSARSAR